MSGASSPAFSPGDELDFDFGAWCPVCERAIPAVAANRPPLQSQPSQNSNGSGGPAAPNSPTNPDSQTSPRPSTSAGAKQRRTSGKKDKDGHHPGAGIGPRRKSSSRLHHAGASTGHKHHKSHSNTSLAALAGLAPLAPAAATTSAAPGMTKEERLKEKARIAKEKEEREEREEIDKLNSLNPPTSLYCSEECRRIDEMRSRLAFADLGPSTRPHPSHSRPPAPQQSSSHSHPSHSPGRNSISPSSQFAPDFSMSRRRLSHTSLSSSAINSATMSTGLGYSGQGSNGSSVSLAQLDFSTRRNSRHQLEGGYSYRPQLMARMSSSEDGIGPGFSRGSTDSLASMGDADERSDKGYAVRPPSALSAFRLMTPISATYSGSPPQRSPKFPRPPPLSRHNTDAPRPTMFRIDSDEDGTTTATVTSTSTVKKLTSPPLPSPRALDSGPDSEPCRPKKKVTIAGPPEDLATARTSPVLSVTSSSLTSTAISGPLLARMGRRSASSASLSLMGSSLGKSYERGGTWGLPKRSESTASLSGLMALGEMIPTSSDTSSSTWNAASSTFVPPSESSSFRSRNATIPRLATSPSSPSSTSSFAHSHSSNRSSSQRSTAGSSDHPNNYGGSHGRNLSSTSLASANGKLSSSVENRSSAVRSSSAGVGNGRRSRGGLMMTPSASSLSNAGSSSYSDRYDSRPTTASGDDGITRASTGSLTSERTPTQSLSKAASLRPAGGSMVNLVRNPSTEGILQSVNEAIGEEADTKTLSGGTIKRRNKEARAMSNPSTVKRPAVLDLTRAHTMAPSGGTDPASPVSPTVPINAATLNPSLSYLHGNALHSHANGHSNSTGKMDQKSRNWSWDHLPVRTYQALDLDKVRREKLQAKATLEAAGNPALNGGTGQASNGSVAPVAPKERKRLFYFSDAGEMEG